MRDAEFARLLAAASEPVRRGFAAFAATLPKEPAGAANDDHDSLLCLADQDPRHASYRVTLRGKKWFINELVTNRDSRAEGLLMNVRMVNAIFEDRRKPDFDPEANTDRFIAQIPDYAAHGVSAFTLCLQGGMPGYEGAVNSAFEPDGSLARAYLSRVRRVIEACDRQGLVVILGCYYQRQDQSGRRSAVRAGVVNVAHWIRDCGFTNVVLEIANEFARRLRPRLLRSAGRRGRAHPAGEADAPGLLVSASGFGDGRFPERSPRPPISS